MNSYEVREAAGELRSECDACGEMKYDCRDIVFRGMDVHACPKCRGCEDDEAADRGDWEFHRDYDR